MNDTTGIGSLPNMLRSTTKLMHMYHEFMQDNDAWEMFIVGAAGTGKTTCLKQLLANTVSSTPDCKIVVCAYTHKACDVLRDVLMPENFSGEQVSVTTLHAYLRKRPTINENANSIDHLTTSTQQGKVRPVSLLFVDEYSMVGSEDYLSITHAQDPDYVGKPRVKVVYIGDKHQLPPIGDSQMVVSNTKYVHELTTVHRQERDNPLMTPIKQLISYIDGTALVTPLLANSNFIRGVSLEKKYIELGDVDKVMLAYTNERVQELNALVQGYEQPNEGDTLFMPAMRQNYSFNMSMPGLTNQIGINRPRLEPLVMGTKYSTLEHLISMEQSGNFNIQFMFLGCTVSMEHSAYAVVFGHYAYNQALKNLGHIATKINKEILVEHGIPGKQFAILNPHSKQTRARAIAWRNYLTFKENVVCVDFTHAMTVHRAQGSTYEHVLLDTHNLAQCSRKDYMLYLRLMYVALSRASHSVYTN